ncbi:MAG: SGNH/GDSL hydrolase family protein [Candidatus Methylacidiphilales bacterium]|nr:SGNH/GDSL hydrolase family protein [Candidatus Methylacidiphilales bacterium]
MSLIHDQVLFHNVEELKSHPASGGLQLLRFPTALANRLGFKNHSRGRFFSQRAAGCEIRFITRGPFVRIYLSVLEQETSLIVYRGDHAHSHHVLRPGSVTSLFLEDPPFFGQVEPDIFPRRRFAPRVWRILFHHDALACYHGVESFGHDLRPPRAEEVPSTTLLAYGSSISYGANAFHPSNAYLQQAARATGMDLLCKAIPGSCMCEPEMVDFLASLQDWDAAFLELGVNMTGWATPEEFESRARHLVTTLHQAHPGKPVYVTPIFLNRAFHSRAQNDDTLRTPLFNAIVPRLVATINHPQVRFMDGTALLPDADGLECDLVHPSDEGHILMGAALARLLASAHSCQ